MYLPVLDSPSGTILVILHQESSSAARVGRILQNQGYLLDERRPSCGDPLPTNLAGYTGVVIFGGPMSANDDFDYIRRETDFVGLALKEEKPLLGICLGAQLIARHLGERVGPHPQGRAEIGYYPIDPTPEGDKLCPMPCPRTVYQWHREGFDLPKGARLLARGGEDFPIQAFAYGSAVALQFHPEVSYSTICRWTTRAGERMMCAGAQPLDHHFDGWFLYDRAIAQWTHTFLAAWATKQPMALSA